MKDMVQWLLNYWFCIYIWRTKTLSRSVDTIEFWHDLTCHFDSNKLPEKYYYINSIAVGQEMIIFIFGIVLSKYIPPWQ